VLVTYKDSVNLDAARQSLNAHNLGFAKHYESVSEHAGRHIGLVRSSNRSTAQLIAELSRDPAIEAVDPNYIRHPYATAPSDTLFSQLWGLQNTGQSVNGATGMAGADIKFLQAWNLARPSTNEIVVAVVDSGVNYTHPDLAANMWINSGEIANNSFDDDGNGFADDVYGYDFGDNDSDPNTTNVHGTHVAGTIAAVGNNLRGVIGVDYKAKIMALKIAQDSNPESFPDSAAIGAINYCILMKSRGVNVVVINASWGGNGFDSALRSAIQSAGNVGIIFCAAAGNDGSNNDTTPNYPGNFRLSNMLVVAATDSSDGLASFSDYGANTVDLGAPGVGVLSTVPSNSVPTVSFVFKAAATFNGSPFEFAPGTGGITGQILDCGLGYPTNFPPAVNGNIALISRGTLFFTDKVSNAIAAGAKAAVIYNNTNGNFAGTLQNASNWIPTVSLSQVDGLALKASLPGPGTVVSTNSGFQFLEGTSMATPHVAGAVAFAAMNFPTDTVAQRIQRIIASTDVVTALIGKTRTGGRLNLLKVVDSDGNGLPDWWEKQYFGVATGTNPAADPDGDGASNMAEFLAGTNPALGTSAFRLLSVTRTNQNLQITWSTVGGHSYVVQQASRLTGGGTNFVDISPVISISGTNEGTTNYLVIGAATNSATFYRVRQ
jgi:subtilisin family serine protease